MKQFNLEEYKKNPRPRRDDFEAVGACPAIGDGLRECEPELRLKSLHQAVCISGIFREDERDTGPRPSVHRIAPALEDCSEDGRGKRREQLVGHDLGWY